MFLNILCLLSTKQLCKHFNYFKMFLIFTGRVLWLLTAKKCIANNL